MYDILGEIEVIRFTVTVLTRGWTQYYYETSRH